MLTEILDYAARAKARLLVQYRELPLLSSYLGELVGRVQEIEASLFDVIEVTSIDTATGVWLERLGALVGEPRGGAVDALFRRYIKARVKANRSRGTFEDVIAVVTEWNGATFAGLELRDLGRATMQVDLDDPDLADEPVRRLGRILSGTRAAGVALELFWQPVASSKVFKFATGTTPEADVDAGFGDTGNAATGGELRAVARY